jgi:hypothetical protein
MTAPGTGTNIRAPAIEDQSVKEAKISNTNYWTDQGRMRDCPSRRVRQRSLFFPQIARNSRFRRPRRAAYDFVTVPDPVLIWKHDRKQQSSRGSARGCWWALPWGLLCERQRSQNFHPGLGSRSAQVRLDISSFLVDFWGQPIIIFSFRLGVSLFDFFSAVFSFSSPPNQRFLAETDEFLFLYHRALVILYHGLGEHSTRYTEFARFFADAGYAVHACDHQCS